MQARHTVRPDRPRLLAFCLFIGLIGERSAHADDSVPRTLEMPAETAPRTSLWRDDWPQYSATEATLTAAAAVTTGVIVLVGPVEQPRWQGPILFDRAVRSQFRASDPETRSRFRTVGNYTYHLSPVIPFFDVLIASALGHSDKKLTLNLLAVTLEAYSYTGVSAFVSTEISARARPDSDPNCLRGNCKVDAQSFFSGHAAIAATAAGLVCANHSRIALYGNAFADAAICALSSLNALATATTRVVADRHYASDVIVGTGVGFGIGYAVPVLLHYSSAGRSVAIGPDPSCGGNCLSVRGTF